MIQKQNQKRMATDHLFFYKDDPTIRLSVNVRQKIRKVKGDSNIYSKNKRSKIDWSANSNHNLDQRIIQQLDEENQNLFQLTKLQQRQIEKFKAKLCHISGDGLL